MKKGFSLVELMVVVGILSIIMLVISQPVASIIKYQRESQITDNMRDNLQFVINKIEKELKTSSNVYVNDAGELKFKDQEGGFVTYSFDSVNKVMKRNGSNFTDKDVFKVDGLNFIVTDKKINLSKLVTVSIDAKSLDNKDSVTMQISITPVNDKPVITDGLTVHLDAGNKNSYSNTGMWNDLSGNNKNFTLSGNPTKSDDDGGYIQFDGNDDYASLISTGISGANTPHSIEMWSNIDADIDDNNRWWLLQLGDNARGTHHWIKDQYGTFGPFDGEAQFQYDHRASKTEWVHLVSTYDGDELKFYINSTNNGTASSKFYFGTGDTPLYIGKKWDRSDIPLLPSEISFKGKISSVRLYNRALTPSEVEYNYNVLKGRFGIN